MPTPDASSRRSWVAAALLPAALALLVHANVLQNGFAGDAVPWVASNPLLQGLARPLEIMASPYRVDVAPAHSPWRPIATLSYALSWSLGGGAPLAYHAFDIALHAAVTVLVCALLGTLGAGTVAAAAGATIFAVHPLHVEAIASIVGRADMLAACFALLAVLAWLRVRGAWRAPIIGLWFLLALGSKESGVVVPLLLLAAAAIRAQNGRSRLRAIAGHWVTWLALLLVLIGYFVARHAVLGTYTGRDVAPYISTLPAPLRITTAIANWSTYARLLLFPLELSADYGPAVILPAGLTSPRFWLGVVLLFGSLVLAVVLRRRAPLASLGVLWFTLAVLPVTNILVPTPVWVAERTLYLASVAVPLGIAALVPAVLRTRVRERRVAAAAGALVVLLLAVRSWERNATWASSDTLARTMIEERPESFRSAWWLARMMAAQGRWERASELYARADSLLPGNVGVLGDHAGMLLEAGQPVRAEAVLRHLPRDVSADAGIFLVRAVARQGRLAEARALTDTLRGHFPRDWRLPAMAAQLDSALSAAPGIRGGGR